MSIYQIRNYFIFLLLIPGISIYNFGIIYSSILGLLGLLCGYIIFASNKIMRKVNFKYVALIVLSIFSFLINSVDSNIIYYTFICFLITLSFLDNSYKSIDHLIMIFKWIIILNVFYGILQYFFTNLFDGIFFKYLNETSLDNYHFKEGRITTVWKEAPRLGCFINALTPFLCIKYLQSKKKIDLLLLIAISVIILLTISRISIVVLVFVLLHYFTKIKWKRVYTIILLVLLVLVYLGLKEYSYILPPEFSRLFESQNDFDDQSDSLNRGIIFLMLIPLIGQSPLVGSGFDYKKLLEPYGFSSPHNTVIELLLVYGIPLTIWILAIFLKRIKTSFVDKEKFALTDYDYSQAASISVFGVFLTSIFHGVYFDLPIFLILWISILLSTKKTLA